MLVVWFGFCEIVRPTKEISTPTPGLLNTLPQALWYKSINRRSRQVIKAFPFLAGAKRWMDVQA